MRKKKVIAQILFVLLGAVCVGVFVTGVVSEMLFLPAFPCLLAFFFTYAVSGNPLTREGIWKDIEDDEENSDDAEDADDEDADEETDNEYFDGNDEQFPDEYYDEDETEDEEEMFGFEEEEEEDSAFYVPDLDEEEVKLDDEIKRELKADKKSVSRKGTYLFLTFLFYAALAITLLPSFDMLKYSFIGAAAVVGIPAFILFFGVLKYYDGIYALIKTLRNVAAKKQTEQAAEETAETEQAEETVQNGVNETSIPAVADLHEREQIEEEKILPTKSETTETTANEKPKFDDGFSGDRGSYNASGESDEETKKRRGF